MVTGYAPKIYTGFAFKNLYLQAQIMDFHEILEEDNPIPGKACGCDELLNFSLIFLPRPPPPSMLLPIRIAIIHNVHEGWKHQALRYPPHDLV